MVERINVEGYGRRQGGVNKAALEYGVPKTTLKDRLAGRGKHRTQALSHP